MNYWHPAARGPVVKRPQSIFSFFSYLCHHLLHPMHGMIIIVHCPLLCRIWRQPERNTNSDTSLWHESTGTRARATLTQWAEWAKEILQYQA